MEPEIVFVDSYRCEPFAQDLLRLALERAYGVAAASPGFLGATVIVGADHSHVSVLVRLAGEDALMRLRGWSEFLDELREAEQLSLSRDPRWFRPVTNIDPRVGIDVGD